MGSGENLEPGKARKLVYNEQSGAFSFESREAMLKRICIQRYKEAATLNRGEKLKLDGDIKQSEKKLRMFSMHLLSDRSASRDALKDLVAHRHVLRSIAASNELKAEHNENFGKYGDEGFKNVLSPRIESEKLRMEPVNRRRAMCQVLLKQRREMTVVQRSECDDKVLRSWSRRHGAATVGRLIVPPIQARPKHKIVLDDNDGRISAPVQDSPNQLASVFITQKGITKM